MPTKKKIPAKKRAPLMHGNPIKCPAFYGGASMHWLDKNGKLHHTDNFPDKSKIMTKAEFKKRFKTK
jgi:hypothetical protein